MVPKKGLEPSHPCEYMDLNHARLPIPPLRLTDRPTCAHHVTPKCPKQHPGCQSARPFAYTVRSQTRLVCVSTPAAGGQSFRTSATRPQGAALPLMTESTPTPLGPSATIPAELAVEIRRIAHDLSNSLEIIVQTSYLLSLAELKEPAAEWLKMLDSGVTKALDLNLQLRDYIKTHTPR